MSWKRFTILICSIIGIAATVQLVIACVGGDPDPTEEPTFFFNTINNQPVYTPFYYTPYLTFYTDWYSFDSTQFNYRPQNENIRSWKHYTGNAVSEADLDSFIYRFAAKDVMRIYEHIRKEYTLSVPPKVARNEFTKWLVSHKDYEATLYLAFAKQCEPYAMPIERFWDDKKNDFGYVRRDSAAMQELVHEGIKRFAAANDPEIKLRYAYQSMRMAFYSGEYPQTLMLANTMLPPTSKHFLYYRCLALKAGALYRTGKKDESAYYYSHVFDSSDEYKTVAYQGFRWAVNGKTTNALLYCKNDHERAVLYIMKGLYDYDHSLEDPGSTNAAAPETIRKMTAAISTAYSYDPKIKGLDVVMTRYLNRIEAQLIPKIATQQSQANPMLTELNAFAQKVADENKRGNRAYWTLAAAYLYLLDGNMPDCKKQLDKAKASKMSQEEQEEHYILSMLYTIRKKDNLGVATEEELLPMLREIETKAQNNRRYKILFSSLMQTIVQKIYLQQKDTAKTLLAYSKSRVVMGSGEFSYYSVGYGSEVGLLLESMSPAQLHRVADFTQKKNKTPFEEWLTANTLYTTDNLYELEATKLIGNLQFDRAVEVLKKVPETLLNKVMLPDVFISHLSETTRWGKSDSAVIYNKLTFASRMQELQQKLVQDPTDSRAAYQYANGLYSMSYYGKGFLAGCYYRSSSDYAAYYLSKDRRINTSANPEYYNVHTAERYYLQASANTTDPEVKARCVFLAAKCWQKNCPVKDTAEYFSGDEKQYYLNSLRNPYFKQLTNEYNTTIFYKKAVGSCAYLQDYLDTRK